MKTAVIIARFQSPYLHDGHTTLIEKVKSAHSKLVIILGVAPVCGSRRNPLDYHSREKMIKSIYPDIVVLPLRDQPNDQNWSELLDELLSTTFPTEQFLLYGSRDSFIPYYSGRFETIELPEHGKINATELRGEYGDRALCSEDFRAGIIYAYHNQYPKTYATVDIAIFRNNKTEILLGWKASEKKWCFVGGFSDPSDDSFEETAKRELQEECGQIEVGPMKYETSSKINDWRYKNETDKIITTLFSCDYMFGKPVPQDDIDRLKWFSISDIPQMIISNEISKEHEHLFKLLLNKYFQVETLKLNGYETK
ncbi:NUDIX domain-containing protein [Marinigracilibium pacificum]|uniref:NUDIX domain-containing protein n=1 Tax=Marinigracilibium pacificum TaxID=2729599 RepID=A0A848J609_9BACT|nr:NUDIX domain-containing protein [Marinigracilibium pacificum]NMM49904.1 NUDIX domain-containing protein [Marinigracilibium pacificum]